MAEKEAERFWTHALALYGRDAVREALLRLQDRDGADVPMILWCVWCGSERHGVAEKTMAEAVELSSVWRREAVEPLRRIRKALKPGLSGVPKAASDEARAKIAEAEQVSERLQMEQLAGLPGETPGGTAAENVDCYTRVAGLSLDASDLSVVLAAC